MLRSGMRMRPETLVLVGAVLAGVAVALGAFGAHVLEGRLTPNRQQTFDTAVQYHMVHALAMLIAAVLHGRISDAWANRAGIAFLVGIALFSGSLYVLVATGVTWLGAITPLGGVAEVRRTDREGTVCVALDRREAGG